VVAAYKRRKRIPFWAMMALSLLPVWAFMYARAVTTQAEAVAGPLAVGDETYGVCASCHGSDGGGGVGYPFTDGEVLLTFPNIEDQLRFVYFGTEGYEAAGVDSYGDPDRPGGPHLVRAFNGAAMPAQGGVLSDAEILGVVCHERYTLGGGDPGERADEFDTWCGENSEIFADLEGGGDIRTLEERFDDILAIGAEPVPGSPAEE
jgi:mono/diheme cytochrome c family protein